MDLEALVDTSLDVEKAFEEMTAPTQTSSGGRKVISQNGTYKEPEQIQNILRIRELLLQSPMA